MRTARKTKWQSPGALKNVAFVTAAAVLLAGVKPALAAGTGAPETVLDVSFQPIPTSAPEIVNPMRGLYMTYDSIVAPTPRLSFVRYKRFLWSQIETSPHHFDFSPIDNEIIKASAYNGKIAFRIMGCSPPGSANQTIGVPSDLPALLTKGYFFTPSGATWKLYVPDYNDPIYLMRGKELIHALAARYNGNPAVAYVEAGLIGSWGEGNYSQMPSPTPSGAVAPSFSTAAQLVDDTCQYFSKTQVVVPTDIFTVIPTTADEKTYGTKYHNALEYALLKHKSIGMFRNSLGDPVVPPSPDWFTAPFADKYVIAAGGAERWQNAPFCAEWYGPSKPISPQLVQGGVDIPLTHVALVTNGALGAGPFAPSDIAQLQADGIASGYRFQLDRVVCTCPQGEPRDLTVTGYWENVGVTPAYDNWMVIYRLCTPGYYGKNGGRKIVWQGASRLNLRSFLPTSGSPVAVQDSFKIPSSVPDGQYYLSVVIRDTSKYYVNPLALAIQGAQGDGSYGIGIWPLVKESSWPPSPIKPARP